MSMQNKSNTIITEEGFELRPYSEEKVEVSISVPKLTFEALEDIAQRRELPLKALIKFYISHGMRQDMTEKESSELALKRLKSRKKAEKDVKIDLAA